MLGYSTDHKDDIINHFPFLVLGNIRVFCRCRPLSKQEVSSGYSTIVDFEGAKDGDIGILTGGSTKKTFKFDRVYAPRDGQGIDIYIYIYAHKLKLNSFIYVTVTLALR